MGATRPDGSSAKTQRVNFTLQAAERIAKAVRKVEQGGRASAGLSFAPRAVGGGGKAFRVCTFTGSWSIGSAKTVTMKNQTTTPNTLAATNLFFPLPDNGQRDCAVAKDGTAWYLVQTKWDATDFVSSASLGTAALEFTRYAGVSLGTATTVQISITTCATATT